MYLLIAAVAVGLILGLLGGPVWILLPWGITGLVLGYFSKNRNAALRSGAIFGFVASLMFMFHGYAGTDPVYTKLGFFFLLGIFGALCGLIAAFVGNSIRNKIKT
jgi:uncharacterized membrane protein